MRGLWLTQGEGAAGFFDAAVAEALAEFEGGGKALAGEFVFAEA